jgi:hypothetical protein
MNRTACDPVTAMSTADYSEPAEVFVARGTGRRSVLGYRRFSAARDAIAYAVEAYATARSDGVVMVVGDKRFDLGAIRSMHEASERD